MFGKLKGVIDYIGENYIILDVNDVGYLVYCTSKTIKIITGNKEKISFFIHTHVKEDSISLYGFISNLEQVFFNHLITVQGIGTKLAIVILSYLTPEEIVNSTLTKNKDIFKPVPGVGPKIVERIFIELENKFKNLNLVIDHHTISKQDSINNEVIEDTILALTNLGYNNNLVNNVVKKIITNNVEYNLNELIKLSLKELNNK